MATGTFQRRASVFLIKHHKRAGKIGIAERLGMGHRRSVSRLIRQGKTDETTQKQCKERGDMFLCAD
jgi:hypothetical protein